MEGGIAILLLVIVLVVAGGIGLVMYLTGGALWARKTSPAGDRLQSDQPEPVEHRHIRPESVVGDDDPAARAARAAEREARRRSTPRGDAPG
ncbi:hypothetical protein [Conexibacter arvalis]|uniref:Uncharacterized protein n=1 Tax=Conexibacter arvalis TaxID=912552 RepID=A0A840IDJ5_9ACTN|nr:hypothetical protein [Conexibacter arvalis]MBB4662303.1 hypothetical protein [Conexibacter arvalis]